MSIDLIIGWSMVLFLILLAPLTLAFALALFVRKGWITPADAKRIIAQSAMNKGGWL